MWNFHKVLQFVPINPQLTQIHLQKNRLCPHKTQEKAMFIRFKQPFLILQGHTKNF